MCTGGAWRPFLHDRHFSDESSGSLTGKPNALRSSTWLGGGHRKIDLPPVGGRGQRLASHQFDRRPILTKKACCVVVIVRFHSNAAGLSASAVRYLKVKIEADCFRIVGLDHRRAGDQSYDA